MPLEQRTRARVNSRHLLLLKGLLVWTVVGVALLAAWRYGLLHEVWRSDSTGLALGITLVFAGTVVRGSWHIIHLSRALNHVAEVERQLTQQGPVGRGQKHHGGRPAAVGDRGDDEDQ